MKILFIAYYYPPVQSIACVRTEAIVRELEKYGCDIRIVTSTENESFEENKKIYRVKHQLKKRNKSKNKIFRLVQKRIDKYFFSLFNFPDQMANWIPEAFKYCDKIMQNEEIDLILSSSSPYSSHVLSNKLKSKYNIPWIADFRDLWTQNHAYRYSNFRRLIEELFEKKIMSKADCLITVSKPLRDSLYSFHKKKTVEIINGFSQIDFNQYYKYKKSKLPLTIVFAGNIWKNYKYDFKILFASLSELKDSYKLDENSLSVEFYGSFFKGEKIIDYYDLNNIVKIHEKISREMMIEKQIQTDLLLFFAWTDPLYPGIYTGKIFEYLSVKRPILSVGGIPGDVVPKLLEATSSGISCFTKDEIKNKIIEYIKEKETTGMISYTGKDEEISKYTHYEMGKKFKNVIDECMKKEA